MKRFWSDQRGNAVIGSAFLVLVLFTLSFVIYGALTIYSNYQNAETELQRAATMTVDGSLENAAIRDLVLDVPGVDAEELFYDRLRELGYERGGTDWSKRVDGKLQYTLAGLAVAVNGRTMTATAVLAMPLLWKTDTFVPVRIPIQVRSSVLYID